MSTYVFAYKLASHNDFAEAGYALAAVIVFIGSLLFVAVHGLEGKSDPLASISGVLGVARFLAESCAVWVAAVIFIMVPLMMANVLVSLVVGAAAVL